MKKKEHKRSRGRPKGRHGEATIRTERTNVRGKHIQREQKQGREEKGRRRGVLRAVWNKDK